MTRSAAIKIATRGIGPPVFTARERVWLVLTTVAHVYGVALKEICAKTRRRRKAAFARQVAMYLSHVVFEIRLAEVARAFGRDHKTAAHAVRRIEELRENPEIDRTIGWLEAMLRRAGKVA